MTGVRSSMVLVLAAVSLVLFAPVSSAQSDKQTLRLVFGLAPGGAHDITARALADALSDMIEGHRSGKFRIIASTGPRRSPLVPDVPTLKESGVDIVSQGAVWVYGPAGMPADIVKRLNTALVKAVSTPDFQQRFTKYGMTVAPSTPEDLAAFQAEELKRWEAPIKASGFKED